MPALRAAMEYVEVDGRDLGFAAPGGVESIISLNIWGPSVGRSMGER